jgi:hypothetical protein
MSECERSPVGLAVVFAIGCGTGGAPPMPAQPPSTAPTAAPSPPPVSTGDPPPASSVPASCRGHDLDLDRLPHECTHELPDATAPGPEALHIVLELPPEGIRSGQQATAWVRFINVSPAPLLLQLNASCTDPFETEIVDARDRRVDLENDIGGLGLCSTTPGVHVLLEPGGRLSKRLDVSARAQHWAEDRKTKTFSLAPGSPIAPGTYTLVLDLPLQQNAPHGEPQRVELTSSLKITPR